MQLGFNAPMSAHELPDLLARSEFRSQIGQAERDFLAGAFPQKVRHVAVHSKDLAHIGPVQIRIEHGRHTHDPLLDAMMPLIEGNHRPGIVFQGHCRDNFVSAGWVLLDFHDGMGVLVFDEIPGSHDLGLKSIHGDDLVCNV